jgi:hypothetical protein
MVLGPSNRYVHSAYQVCDLDALAAGGEYLRELGYSGRGGSAGTSRAARSSTTGATRTASGRALRDGDMFDNTLEPGWAPYDSVRSAQWGPPATKDFLGLAPAIGSGSGTAGRC